MSRRPRRAITGGTVVVTGAASGIGRALAQRLGAAGAALALADVDAEGLAATAAPFGDRAFTRVLDVRDPAGVREFAAAVRSWAPAPISVVFNNAGVAVSGSVLAGSPDDDEWLRQINYDGVVNGTRAFLPLLVEQGSGVVANTSSVYGLAGVPMHSAYCASKFAVRGFTDALRQELRGTGVDAVVIHPGGITTNIARNARWTEDPEGRGRSVDELAAEFESMTMTSPEKAAEIICSGIERGRSRILVGPDARVFDLAVRLAPTHYFAVVAKIEAMASRLAPGRPATPPAPAAGNVAGGVPKESTAPAAESVAANAVRR